MALTDLQSEIHALSRQEKYRLVRFIVFDLAQEESPPANRRFASDKLRQRVRHDTSQAQAIDKFLKKWKGFLKGVNADDAKYRYLQEKYR